MPILRLFHHGPWRYSDGREGDDGRRSEFLTKPVREQALLDAVGIALERDRIRRERDSKSDDLRARYESLSARERKALQLEPPDC